MKIIIAIVVVRVKRGKVGPGIDEIIEKLAFRGDITIRLDSGFTIGVVKEVIREMMMVGEGTRQRVVLRVDKRIVGRGGNPS